MKSTRRQWLVIVVAVLAAWPIWRLRNSGDQPGSVVTARITLVSSDREDLSCASGKAFGRLRCEFQASGDPWPEPPAPRDTLAPYLTVSRGMYLIPALFAQPALAARYAQESGKTMPRDELPRFVARCELRLLERLEAVDGPRVRWTRDGTWGEGANAWVAEPISCRIEGS